MTAPAAEKTKLERLAEWDFHESGPVATLDEALPHLRRPFAPAAVRWKVQTARSGFGTVIAYIDARLVVERLNLVCGAEWSDAEPKGGYRSLGQGIEECKLSVFDTVRADVGVASGTQAAKGMRSDALKRAAVKFGVGVSIYAMKAVELKATPEWDPEGDRLLIANLSKPGKGQNARPVWSARMSVPAERYLAALYERWLLDADGRTPAVALFGPPLDHGDEFGAQGMEAEEGAAVAAPEQEGAGEPERVGQPVVDERMSELLSDVEAVYGRIKEMNPAQIPPGRHKAAVSKAQGRGHDAVEKYLTDLRAVETTMKEARS